MLVAAAVWWMTQGGSNMNNYAMLNLEIYDTEHGELQCDYRKGLLHSPWVWGSRLLHILGGKMSRRIAYKGKL